MVNTVVTFENNRVPSVTPFPVVIEKNNRSSLQRRIYLIIGILILTIILIPNILSIEKDYDDFAFHLLFIVHASFLLLFFISTAIYRHIGDGITTIPSLILFAVYKTIHYLIRYRYCRINSRTDFLITTIQLTVILIFVVTYILWTYLLIKNKYQKKTPTKIKTLDGNQKRIFYSFLALNLMLTISSLILNIRSQQDFGLHQIIILSTGIPFALIWCTIGVLMSIYKNCLCISSFYFLSIIQPFHLIYLIFQTINELYGLSSDNELNIYFSLFIIIFVCVSTNFLVHLFTTISGCWMISRTDKTIVNTRWMIVMSASINDGEGENECNQSLNYDEIEDLIANDNDINTESRITIDSSKPSNEKLISQQCRSSSCITQAQSVSLSLGKSSGNIEENSANESNNKSKMSMLSTKTSNIPGPVGLLPMLKTNDDLRRLKEDKTARDTLLTNEEDANVKRPKTSSDLFSLNIDNYPSYMTAFEQLQQTFNCEPISINTALVKARLGIKKRIPLMCAAVTHYDRQENTILLDKSAHIRATFIGDDELLENFNIRVGHTLVLRNVAVFTSTRHRHHYVNIHLQNIIAIQDPLNDSFSMPSMGDEQDRGKSSKSILYSIENELSAYEDSSKANNETFHIFSQSDHDDDEQPPLKKMNTNFKSSNNSAFNHVKSKSPPSANKFKQTIVQKPQAAFKPPYQPQNVSIPTVNKLPSTTVTDTPPSSIAEPDLLEMIDKPIDADFDSEDLANEFFTTW